MEAELEVAAPASMAECKDPDPASMPCEATGPAESTEGDAEWLVPVAEGAARADEAADEAAETTAPGIEIDFEVETEAEAEAELWLEASAFVDEDAAAADSELSAEGEADEDEVDADEEALGTASGASFTGPAIHQLMPCSSGETHYSDHHQQNLRPVANSQQ